MRLNRGSTKRNSGRRDLDMRKKKKMKLYLRSGNARKTKDKESSSTKIKPPRLVKTEFEDTYLDGLRFWSQYDT